MTEQTTTAEAQGKKPPRADASITPRVLRELDAARYAAFSTSYLRNLRTADMRRKARGEPIAGPQWIHVGSAVRYLREDLDDWINSFRLDPGQGDPEVRGAA